MDFAPHFWKLLSLRSIEAVVTVQPNIECSRYEDNSAGERSANFCPGTRDPEGAHFYVRQLWDGKIKPAVENL
jgi:hypothetical protein